LLWDIGKSLQRSKKVSGLEEKAIKKKIWSLPKSPESIGAHRTGFIGKNVQKVKGWLSKLRVARQRHLLGIMG